MKRINQTATGSTRLAKAIAVLAAAMMAAFLLAACSSSNGSASGEATSTEEQQANTGTPNPWKEAETPDGAGQGAGFGNFTIPESGTTVGGATLKWEHFQFMDQLAEADGSLDATELIVRKGVKNPAKEVSYDTADVSGDYNTYAHEWSVEAANFSATCAGNTEGHAQKVIWSSDNFSYSIMVRNLDDPDADVGLSDKDVIALVDAIE